MIGNKLWDVIIVGGGPAGRSAAMVLARSRRSVLIIDEGKQRNLKSHGLHNFLTRDGILPPDFLQLAQEELARYKVPVKKLKVVQAIRSGIDHFEVEDHKGGIFYCRRILLATGVTDDIPDVPGMKELWGRAVFHCPFCDGYECLESHIGLYARIHNGYGMALALRHLSRKLTLYTDGKHYLKQDQRRQLLKRDIDIVTRKVSHLVHKDGKLLGVHLADGHEIPCDSMFVHHGHQVNGTLLDQFGCRRTVKGSAITSRHQESSEKGIYIAGDAAIDAHFVIVASAEGVKAGVAIHNDLLAEDNREAMEVKDT
jgi:thioredoxin reductase